MTKLVKVRCSTRHDQLCKLLRSSADLIRRGLRSSFRFVCPRSSSGEAGHFENGYRSGRSRSTGSWTSPTSSVRLLYFLPSGEAPDLSRSSLIFPIPMRFCREILSRITPTTSTLSLWQPIFHRTLSTVQAVWEATRGVLSASPALGTSEDAEAVDHEEARALLAIEASAGDEGEGGETGSVGLKHQIVLSWAWRGIKESRFVPRYPPLSSSLTGLQPHLTFMLFVVSSSSLLSAITTLPLRLASRPAAKGLSSSTDSGPPLIWSRQDLETAGSHFITLLTEIRHPGVFLAIYPNYSDLVSAIAKSSPSSTLGSVEMKTLPRKWLDVSVHPPPCRFRLLIKSKADAFDSTSILDVGSSRRS
jgi:hypothetical protein